MFPFGILRTLAGAVVLALVLALGAQTWRVRALTTRIATDRATQAEANRMRERAITIANQETDRNAAARNIQTRNTAVRAAAAGDGLRQRAAHLGAMGAATASQCPDAAEAALVLADVPGRLDIDGRAIAEWADQLDTALDACQRAYNAARSRSVTSGGP